MAITTTINWPAGLPCALREGHSTQHATPFTRTTMDSGRARQRRKFSSVPSTKQFSWYFTEVQCLAFEAWFRDALQDGAKWFNMTSRTPLGQTAPPGSIWNRARRSVPPPWCAGFKTCTPVLTWWGATGGRYPLRWKYGSAHS